MAGQISVPILDMTFKSFGDQRSNQFHFQELKATDVVQRTSAVTAVAIGILQNQPNSGGTATVRLFGITKVKSGVAITFGNLVGTNAGGAGMAVTPGSETTQYISAAALESVSSGDIVSVAISPIVHRAA